MNHYSNVTRLLCASAILMGKTFRQTLLDHYEQKRIACAPEIGLDVRQLVQVALLAENWGEERDRIRRRYGWGFLALAVIGLILWFLILNPIVVIAIVWAIGFVLQWIQLQSQKKYDLDQLLENFKRSTYNPSKIEALVNEVTVDPDVESGLPRSEQNVVVYQGFLPFIGAGVDLDGWSFVTNITYGAENALGETATPISFEVTELYDYVMQRLAALQFPGMAFQDMLYVNGQDIRDNRLILPDIYRRPVQALDAETLRQYMISSDPLIRHYKWIRIHYSDDELILSFFLRFSLRGNNLFSELNRFLLTPPGDAYRELDNRRNINKEGWKYKIAEFIGALIQPILLAPFSLLAGVFLPVELINGWLARRSEKKAKEREEEEARKNIDENPRCDWGVVTSIRDMVSSQRYQRYFQKLDKDMYNKVLERTILDSIVEFLDSHCISTDDLKERRTTILNSGVIVQGGNIETQVMAVGEGATASQQNTRSEQKEKKEG